MLWKRTSWLILAASVGGFSFKSRQKVTEMDGKRKMSIQQAINKIVETLQKIPQNIIPPGHIGVKHPMSQDALPTIVISVKNIKESSSGIGNFIGIQKGDVDRISEIKGSKISGIFQIKIWDLSADKIDEITTSIIEIITANKIGLRRDGFLNLSLVDEICPSKLSADPPKEAMVRLIEYKGMFEFINRNISCPEEVIKEVHVRIDDVFNENVAEDFFDENMIVKKRQ